MLQLGRSLQLPGLLCDLLEPTSAGIAPDEMYGPSSDIVLFHESQ